MGFLSSVDLAQPVFPTMYRYCARSSGASKTSFSSSETQ